MTDVFLSFTSFALVAISIRQWIGKLKRVEIPTNRTGFVAAWVLAAGLGIAALAGGPGWLVGIPAGLAVFASAFFLLTVAIGRQQVDGDAIRVGATIPDFTAIDEHEQTFDSQSLAGHPVLIKFFRGHW